MTELKLEFELENAELPIDYDKVILSFMKAAIENFSPDLFDRLYTVSYTHLDVYKRQVFHSGARISDQAMSKS